MSSYLKNKDKALYLTEDIIEELSEKTGKSKELLNDIMKHNLAYLKKSIVEDSNVVLINIPNMGKLRFNYYLGGCYDSKTNTKRGEGYLSEKLAYLKSFLKKEKGHELKNFNKPIVYNLLYSLKKEVPRNLLNVFYMSWRVLEDEHNKNHEKYFNKS